MGERASNDENEFLRETELLRLFVGYCRFLHLLKYNVYFVSISMRENMSNQCCFSIAKYAKIFIAFASKLSRNIGDGAHDI